MFKPQYVLLYGAAAQISKNKPTRRSQEDSSERQKKLKYFSKYPKLKEMIKTVKGDSNEVR